ncbi:MAG TPA: phosphopyruvate hydratase [Halobacteriales archaeon]|uniref:phosphopyruvate hydratase n=1 Tax=Candidatus Hikarchaeum yamanae TaxID=2675326 RepID=UPI0017DD98B2|nr:phosphopyruvate hydratase [Halobacteriales archaeon]
MSIINSIHLGRVFDSRGNLTVEASIQTQNGGFGRAIAPSGASTGEYEAIELPTSDAISAAKKHALHMLEGKVDSTNQTLVDNTLRSADGTENFSVIGANSAVAISLANAKAAANSLNVPLYQHIGSPSKKDSFPIPLGNVIGGGAHAADSTYIQEFLSVPVGAPCVFDAIFANTEVHKLTGTLLSDRGYIRAKGDEGGWAAPISDEVAFDVMSESISNISNKVGFEIKMGVDMAASELYDSTQDCYDYGDISRSVDEQIDYVSDLSRIYSLAYIEDPLDQDDFEGFSKLTNSIGESSLVCGDDLFATNVTRLKKGIDLKAANSILIKPNQIGTLTETLEAINLAKKNNITPVVSHRSGETEDTTISHIAFATHAPYIKTGAVGGERTTKLNELIRIEQEIKTL